MSDQAAGPPDDPWAALAEATAAASAERPKTGKRERVVLAQWRSSRRVVRALAELEEQTGVGVEWVRLLMRAQLMLAIRLMLLTVMILGSTPLGFLLVPQLGTVSVFGIPLPWLLLGVAVYPLFVAVAWSYNRSADRNEQEFTVIVKS
ncbi:MAG: hypothetical protein ACRDRP_16745 [Pseudonocardiaceae bacterium]